MERLCGGLCGGGCGDENGDGRASGGETIHPGGFRRMYTRTM